MKVVFSIGGSILAPDSIDKEYVGKLALMLRELSQDNQLVVVVGGGKPARDRIAEARSDGASWAACDYVGILATRDNAKVLIETLAGASNTRVPESIHEAADLFGEKILVLGGTEPGHSTDAVAALIADWIKADLFINASNVDAVYDKNPQKFKDAKPLTSIKIEQLNLLLQDEGFRAGEYPLLDYVALKTIQRSKIKTIILDGHNLDNLKASVAGRPFKGTTVLA